MSRVQGSIHCFGLGAPHDVGQSLEVCSIAFYLADECGIGQWVQKPESFKVCCVGLTGQKQILAFMDRRCSVKMVQVEP